MYGQKSSIVIHKCGVSEFPTCFSRAAIFYGKNILILSLFWQVFKSFSSIPILLPLPFCVSLGLSLSVLGDLCEDILLSITNTEDKDDIQRKTNHRKGKMRTWEHAFPKLSSSSSGPLKKMGKPIKGYTEGLLTKLQVGNWNITM